MTAIIRSDPPERLVLHNTAVWCTRHHLSDGTHWNWYEEETTRGMCGLRNGDGCQAPIGTLHPQCVRCHALGHCKDLCPVEVPGFVCTASMDPESREAGWGTP